MKSPLNRGGLRFYLVIIALVGGTLCLGTTTPATILAGLPCLFLGVWLHVWAKGCLRQNQFVAVIGPYRFVRHPFYLANSLIDAGLAVMSGWWPLAVILPVWWLAIYLPVIRGEERHLANLFPDEYPEYIRRVACLLPWRRPLPRPKDSSSAGFRWDNPNIAAGEELPRAARIMAYPLLFFVAEGLRGEQWTWFSNGWNLLGLTGLIALYGVAALLHIHQRKRNFILPQPMRGPLLRAAAGAAVLTAVIFISGPRTAFRDDVSTLGAALMLLSVPVYSRRPLRAILAEMLAVAGVVAAGELLWLAPGLILVYTAWILDFRLAAALREGQGAGDRKAPFWPYFYPLLALAAAAVIGIKLVGHGLPYH